MKVVSDGASPEKIQELKDLMSRNPIDRKRGPIDGGGFEIDSLRGSTNARNAN